MSRRSNRGDFFEDGIIIDPISDIYCPKCKSNQSYEHLCVECENGNYPFESLFALGYYLPRWSRKKDTQISPEYLKNRMGNINPRYLFSELIIHAKGKSKIGKPKKDQIYQFLTRGFANKLKSKYLNVLKEVDFLVHVPKPNEHTTLYYHNHAISYTKFLSKELNIPFERYMLKCMDYNRPISIEYNEEKIIDSTIMIVDDTFTKGNTKGPISKLLVDNGARKVYIGVIGRTMDMYAYYSKKPVTLKPFEPIEPQIVIRKKQNEKNLVTLSTDNIHNALTYEWQPVETLALKLKIKDKWDVRFLKIKLKELLRKGNCICNDNGFWKRI